MNFFATIISAVTNPLVISAPLAFALVYKTSEDIMHSLYWTSLSLFFAFLVGLFVYYGVKKGFFSDFDISVRTQRGPIFIFAAAISVIFLVLIFIFNGPQVLLVSVAALLLGVFLDSIINKKIKASIHLAVYSSFALIVGILYGGLFWLMLMFAPLVAWSRIRLRRHILAETIVGTMLGFLLVILVYIIIKYT